MSLSRWFPAALAALVLACDGSTAPPPDVVPEMSRGRPVGIASGGGHYDFAGAFNIQFSLSAIQHAYGSASGNFQHSTDVGGLLVDFHGTTTCLAVDSENGRAWIGGVITLNKSTHPSFQGDIFDPGKDIWFRVLDTGPSSSEPDRTTFVGFEGSGGIITSAEYCEARDWPDDNDRTHPVTGGNITVLP